MSKYGLCPRCSNSLVHYTNGLIRCESCEYVSQSPIESDPVNHPKHYTGHPSGVECIQITEHMNFCLGNAIKYIWRADLKNDAIEDLEKAKWYIEREIKRRRES